MDSGGGKPLAGKELLVETQNLAPDGRVVLDGTQSWSLAGWAETNANGEFVTKLPPGPGRVSLRSEGLVSEQDYYEIDVRLDEVNRFADITASKPPFI